MPSFGLIVGMRERALDLSSSATKSESMGYLRSRLGVGKPVLGGGLGAFHLFLSVTFYGSADGNVMQLGTSVLLLFVGSGMLLWGYAQLRRTGVEQPAG
jgi:hypothetical protein